MLKKHSKFFRFIIYYFTSILLIYLVEHVIFGLQILQVFNIKEHVLSDIRFNDLYYVKHGEKGSESYMDSSKNVFLINIQDISYSDSGRLEYKRLLNKISSYKPGAVGIDVTFSKKGKDVFDSFKSNPKFIFANPSSENDIFFKNNGDITFPRVENHEQRTIRYYHDKENSFAAKLVKTAYPKANVKIGNSENFIIRYNTINDGLSHVNDMESDAYDKNYLFLNSKEIMNDSLNLFEDYLKDKIIIVGYLGNRSHFNAKFDIEDKKRVPVDVEHFVNREPLMFGSVVHANAISNILQKESRFYEVNELVIMIINLVICAVFMYVLLFMHLGKLWNRLILLFLTIPMLFLILQLMELGIYYKLGGTLFALLIIEEMYEILEPFEHRFLSKYFSHE